jgi:hypothetical protein
MERRTDTDTLRGFIEAVEKLAFEMPAPNPYTPRLLQMCITARFMIVENNNQRADPMHLQSALWHGEPEKRNGH